jgi:CHAT domain-containing protein
LRRGDARAVLDAAERHRAQALRYPPVRPPVDPVLARLLGELRRAAQRVDGALRDEDDPRPALADVARLERAVVDYARHARAGGAPPPPSTTRLAPALGERVLVELVAQGGALYAVTLARGRARLHELGTVADAERELERLRFALRRELSGQGTERGRARIASAAGGLAAQLEPALRVAGDAPLVIVPTRALHALPWAALPPLRGRAFTVAPSARLWLQAAERRARPGRVLAVAGPGLPDAEAEAAAIDGALLLRGADATAAATLAALDGCEHAHIAAHGRFRADHPLFSSLRLADGQLTVYDLEMLARVPRRIALFACDAGVAAVHPGDELMGFAAALLGLGTTTVIASVLPLPDAAGIALAPRLATAAAPDAELAAAGSEALSGLVCFGAV